MLFFTVALVHLVALMSPGPDFFFVSQTAVGHSRRQAMCAVLGITLGIMAWAAIALLGLNLLLQQMAWLHRGIAVAGGAYLGWLGFQMLRASFAPGAGAEPSATAPEQRILVQGPTQNRTLFLRGVLVNLSNPKALVYFGSVFSLFVGPGVSAAARWGIFSLVAVESLLWFALVAAFFTLPAIRRAYRRFARWIDRIAGCLFVGFGLRLIFSGPGAEIREP